MCKCEYKCVNVCTYTHTNHDDKYNESKIEAENKIEDGDGAAAHETFYICMYICIHVYTHIYLHIYMCT